MALKEGGIVILDYGSQTAQLIARRVRDELGVLGTEIEDEDAVSVNVVHQEIR